MDRHEKVVHNWSACAESTVPALPGGKATITGQGATLEYGKVAAQG